MRAGLVGIFFFAALLGLGHYVGAPMFCRGSFSIPTLDAAKLCGADLHLNRQGSQLLYFASVAAAMFFGILSSLLPGGRKQESKKNEAAKLETFEEIVAAQEGKPAAAPEASAAAVVVPAAAVAAVAATVAAETTDTSAKDKDATDKDAKDKDAKPETTEASDAASAPVASPVSTANAESAAEAAVAAAILSATGLGPDLKPVDAKPDGDKAADAPANTEAKSAETSAPEKAPESEKVIELAAAKPEVVFEAAEPVKAEEPEPEKILESAIAEISEPEPEVHPETLAAAEAISASLAAHQSGARRLFEGTNEELVERFRELRRIEGVNSIAQAQRLLDESTLGAQARGIDPKQHLSDVAHLVLAEDPDLKSGVVRGVVVHIAARLKELGVAQSIPSQTDSAA